MKALKDIPDLSIKYNDEDDSTIPCSSPHSKRHQLKEFELKIRCCIE